MMLRDAAMLLMIARVRVLMLMPHAATLRHADATY